VNGITYGPAGASGVGDQEHRTVAPMRWPRNTPWPTWRKTTILRAWSRWRRPDLPRPN